MKHSNKYNILNTWSIVFLIIGCIIAFIFFTIILSHFASSSTVSQSSADGFNIQAYKVLLNVNENNTIDVKEYITVYFYESGHHGIYRFIPEWLEYTGKDNITISRKSIINNLVSYSDNYTTGTINGKKQIKMGNEDVTLSIGTHTYTIGYTYDMGVDPYDGFDELIFHAFGDYWGTEITNASVEITLPKDADLNENNIHFFSDKYRASDITSYVYYYNYNNTIYATLSSTFPLYSSLTIDIELPDGYFITENSSNYGFLSSLFCIICIAFAIITFLLWLKNGKDLDKIPETVEFYPPDQLDAAQIGYLYKNENGKKLSIALIVELASKGFIKINESLEKATITISKATCTDVDKAINREVKIVKLKNYRPGFLIYFSTNIKNRKILMDYYFRNVNEHIITNKFDKFYRNVNYLINHKYIKVEYDSIHNYSSDELENIKKELLINEFKDKPKMTQNEKIIYDQLFKDDDETVLSKNYTFYEVFSKIADNLAQEFNDKINDLTAYKCRLLTSFGFALCTILLGIAYCVIEDLASDLNCLYYFAAISNTVTLLFSILMKRKNSYGEQIQSKISGFKNYIEVAEKNQIDMLVEENPNYFYDILPYAYVLGISTKWIQKFENIPVPTSDMGNFDYFSTGSLDYLSTSIYYPSSSGNSSNGGCSSCGGGCSSCGGGGSW